LAPAKEEEDEPDREREGRRPEVGLQEDEAANAPMIASG
jgi:hypothetical protein